ncbi:MAG: hypothetical protein JXM73_08390, partial [Anaerolineae bacterium]|nr:hypothetical protein [Anaerolineae bacterium]
AALAVVAAPHVLVAQIAHLVNECQVWFHGLSAPSALLRRRLFAAGNKNCPHSLTGLPWAAIVNQRLKGSALLGNRHNRLGNNTMPCHWRGSLLLGYRKAGQFRFLSSSARQFTGGSGASLSPALLHYTIYRPLGKILTAVH